MSGIAAIFHADGAPVAERAITAIVEAMSYRARDGRGTITGGECALGHCALHTIAADRGEAQPLVSPDGRFHITFDGYLLNGPELRRSLAESGAPVRSERDADTVLQAFRCWGEDMLPRLEGEFAFVIWDAEEKQLLCARDHHGLRPLTWHWNGRRLLVASDIAGVLAALDGQPPVNSGYLVEHLANEWYSQDETVWQSVHKLRPAHCLTISRGDGQPKLREYWTLPLGVSIRYASDAEFAEQYRSMLGEVVRAVAVSDAPVAAEVSGGLDSSAVFAMAARAADEGRLAAPAILPFSLRGYASDKSDEIAMARAVVSRSGRSLNEVPLFEPILAEFTAQSVADRTIAFAPNTAMFTDLAAAMSKATCRVALTGQGGDTWLNGTNAQFNQALRLADWRGAASSIAADKSNYGWQYAFRKALRQGAGLLAPEALKHLLRSRNEPEDHPWLTPEAKRELTQKREVFWEELAAAPSHERHKWLRIKEPFTTLAMEMVNLTAAKQGIEIRHPMLSRRFIEFCATMPEHVKRRGAVRKWVHREAMAGILPEETRNRQDKAYFDTTFRSLQAEMRDLCARTPVNKPLDAILRPAEAQALFTCFYNAEIDDGAIWELWGIYSCQQFVATFAGPNGAER